VKVCRTGDKGTRLRGRGDTPSRYSIPTAVADPSLLQEPSVPAGQDRPSSQSRHHRRGLEISGPRVGPPGYLAKVDPPRATPQSPICCTDAEQRTLLKAQPRTTPLPPQGQPLRLFVVLASHLGDTTSPGSAVEPPIPRTASASRTLNGPGGDWWRPPGPKAVAGATQRDHS